MPLYRVVCDNVDILDYASKDLTLLAPDLELEINTAGSLEFTMPPYHKYYDNIRPLLSTIEVYEDDELIWFGRPTEVGIDFFKQKRVYCEGPLSFFNDSVQRPDEFNNHPLHDFFSYVISRHNEQMTDRNRQFYVGTVEIENKSVYRKLNYESTYQVLTDMCLNAEDGYFFFRRENGVNRIDWVKNMPYTCNQPIQFGLNLLNYKSNFDATDYATCIIPLGANDKETGKPITVANANNGSDILRSDAVSTYGPITKVQTWSDIKDPYALWEEGNKYLENTQFNSLVIECSAADLHSKNVEFEMFKVGQMARCISIPHFIDSEFPISKMSLRLDSAAKVITLGILKRRTLTRIYKQEIEEASGYDPTNPDSYTPVNPGGTEEPGDEWELIWPEDPGEPVTGQRLPTKITVATKPNKTDYNAGDDIDWTGLQVNIWTQDKDGKDSIWTNPPKYIDGRAPMSELSFSVEKAPNVSGDFNVEITWKYKDKNYSTTLQLSTKSQHGIPYTTGNGSTRANKSEIIVEAPYIVILKLGANKFNIIMFSKNQGATGKLSGHGSTGASINKSFTLSRTYTKNGKTVYYNIPDEASGFNVTSWSYPPTISSSPAEYTDPKGRSPGEIAWTVLYG